MSFLDNDKLAYWIDLLRKYKSSGLNEDEFCKLKNISVVDFTEYKQLIETYDRLDSLPVETDSNFAFQARKIIECMNNHAVNLSKIIDNRDFPEKIRFNALYCLLAFLWQARDFEQYRQLVDKNDGCFDNHIMFFAFRSQYYSSRGKNISNARLALDYAIKAKNKAPNLPNVLHLFAAVVVDLFDITDGKVENRLIVEAEHAINKAIAIVDGKYARYFATKADLLGKIGRFSEANDLIQKAIEVEPSGRDGYALRIGDYQQIRLTLQFLKHSHLLQLKQNESIDKLEEVRLRVVELLGILSAIIALLVTSVQIGKSLVFTESARLMVISGGVILMIFSSYSIIFSRSKIRLSQIIVLFFSMVVIAIFYFLPELTKFILSLI